MATLNDAPAAVTPEPPEIESADTELDDDVARAAAADVIRRGITSEAVREYAADHPSASRMFLGIADAMDALLAEGRVPAGDGAR